MPSSSTQLSKAHYELLAALRYALRRFLHFSHQAAAESGLKPQQHQALLAIKGFPGRDYVSIRELAERAMVSKSSIVSLEHGKSCRPSTLAKVCTAMNLHLERLIADPDQEPTVKFLVVSRRLAVWPRGNRTVRDKPLSQQPKQHDWLVGGVQVRLAGHGVG